MCLCTCPVCHVRGDFPAVANRLPSRSICAIALQLVIDDVTLNNSGEKFLQNKEMYPPYKPFKIVLTKEGTISHVVFKEGDPIWSMNFKRAIASTLKFQINSSGAFVLDEVIKSSGAFVVNEVRMTIRNAQPQAIFIGVAFFSRFRRASMACAPPSTLCPIKPMVTYPYARHPS